MPAYTLRYFTDTQIILSLQIHELFYASRMLDDPKHFIFYTNF
jgi:hypothetical protein